MEKRKMRLIVLDGEITADDLLRLKQGGFFEGAIVLEVPLGMKGQIAELSVPTAPPAPLQTEVFGRPMQGTPAPAQVRTDPVLTPDEACAFGFFERVPANVMQAYADGAAVRHRNEFHSEEQIALVLKAYTAVKNGARTPEQAHAWWKSSGGGIAQPTSSLSGTAGNYATSPPPVPPPPVSPPPAPPTAGGHGQPASPPPPPAAQGGFTDEQVAMFNSRRYLRQIVSDLIDLGYQSRGDIFNACTQLADRVARIKAEGSNLQARIDMTLSAIGR